MAYKVLIVEDQKIPRQLFEMFVNDSSDYELMYSIESASVAHIYCDRYNIDLVLMDVVMQDGSDGLSAAARIKKNHPDTKVIIVTSMPEVSYISRAMDINADGFWYKELDETTLVSVMNRVMAGEKVYPEDPPRIRLGLSDSLELTPKETEVLRELTTGATNYEISKKLGIDVTTVKTHIRHMLQKTGFPNRTTLAIEARVAGIVISTDGSGM